MRLTDEPKTETLNSWWKMSEEELLEVVQSMAKEMAYKIFMISTFDDPYEIRNRTVKNIHIIEEIVTHKFGKKIWLDDDRHVLEFRDKSMFKETGEEGQVDAEVH